MLNFIHENKINLMTSGSVGVATGTGVCETLMSDVLVPEAHQNDCSYTLSSVNLLSIHYARFSIVGSYIRHLKKPQNCLNWVVGACPGQYGNIYQ